MPGGIERAAGRFPVVSARRDGHRGTPGLARCHSDGLHARLLSCCAILGSEDVHVERQRARDDSGDEAHRLATAGPTAAVTTALRNALSRGSRENQRR